MLIKCCQKALGLVALCCLTNACATTTPMMSESSAMKMESTNCNCTDKNSCSCQDSNQMMMKDGTHSCNHSHKTNMMDKNNMMEKNSMMDKNNMMDKKMSTMEMPSSKSSDNSMPMNKDEGTSGGKKKMNMVAEE